MLVVIKIKENIFEKKFHSILNGLKTHTVKK